MQPGDVGVVRDDRQHGHASQPVDRRNIREATGKLARSHTVIELRLHAGGERVAIQEATHYSPSCYRTCVRTGNPALFCGVPTTLQGGRTRETDSTTSLVSHIRGASCHPGFLTSIHFPP